MNALQKRQVNKKFWQIFWSQFLYYQKKNMALNLLEFLE